MLHRLINVKPHGFVAGMHITHAIAAMDGGAAAAFPHISRMALCNAAIAQQATTDRGQLQTLACSGCSDDVSCRQITKKQTKHIRGLRL